MSAPYGGNASASAAARPDHTPGRRLRIPLELVDSVAFTTLIDNVVRAAAT